MSVQELRADQGSVGLSDLAVAVVRRRVLAATLLAAGVLAGVAYAVFAPPTFRAEVVAAPLDAESNLSALSGLANQFGEIAAMVGINAMQGSDRATSVATLTSNAFLGRFIIKWNLGPRLFPDEWPEEAADRRADAGSDAPTLNEAVRLFEEHVLTVTDDAQTGLLTIAVSWTDPVEAAAWANALVEDADVALRDAAQAGAVRSIAYLNAELAKTQVVELRTVLFHLVEEQERIRMLATVRDEFAFRVIDPAIAPDIDDWLRPNRLLAILLGIVGGAILALGGVVLAEATAHVRRAVASRRDAS